ncbi:acyl-CoA/acyl-ACP dehydrogenase [Porticoccaceae bacterium]|nr:acyl-CoA/acyl-ACP dehydrogenase [Porticoccaceae bacterium]MDB2400282.1 acyl-CoA/acyl-ACP dehydrogenase [Porticoccaceae bacterium]MDG1782069.1 acyl-CoA/acyl-ACP dehydrogenase [Porticoccaceae bacterium]
MNFDFSDDQKSLQDETHRFLRDRCDLSVARLVLDDQQQAYSESVWREMVELGWTGITIPEQYGGIGLGYLELCVMAEEMGRFLAPVPFSSTLYQFCEALLNGASKTLKQEILPQVAAGKLIGTMAFAEGIGFPDPDRIGVRFKAGKLYGDKWPVADAMIAGAAVVLAVNEDNDPCLCFLDLDQEAVHRRQLESVDPSRSQGGLEFFGAEAENLTAFEGGSGKSGWQLFQRVLNAAAVLFAFEQIGGADACLAAATEFSRERHAFGRPIGSFQAIKHKLVDVYVANQLARSNAYYGAWALATGAEELPLAASVARVSATQAYEYAASENIQVHGGMGFTWEADCHLYLRRSRTLALLIGSSGLWKKQVTSELQRKFV